MPAIVYSLGMFIADLFKPGRRLEAENLFLRHQLSIALRRAPPPLWVRCSDRALLGWMTPLLPSLLATAQIVQPETIPRLHRAGFAAFLRWESRQPAGRPKIDRELRDLIRRMSKENPKWGASQSLSVVVTPNTRSPPAAFEGGYICHKPASVLTGVAHWG